METLRYFGGDKWIAGRFAEQAMEVRDSWAAFATRRIVYALVFGLMLAVQIGVTFAVLLPRYRSGELSASATWCCSMHCCCSSTRHSR